ncbi:jg4582, partial [Pararge aegeria aegeria]
NSKEDTNSGHSLDWKRLDQNLGCPVLIVPPPTKKVWEITHDVSSARRDWNPPV